MRDALKMFSYSKKKMELQMVKTVNTISLKTPGVWVLKHYCNSKKVCEFVGLGCNNLIIMHGIIN